jgi:hypothetical protein
MKEQLKDLSQKLKKLGISLVDTAKKGVEKAKSGLEQTLLEDNLRRRFNLENPYRFEVYTHSKTDLLMNFLPRHAKRYDEDNLFVFYGTIEFNDFQRGYIIKDLSDNSEYSIEEIVEVTIPVEYENVSHYVTATAVTCKSL